MNCEELTARCWAEISMDEICGNYRRACEISKTKVICVLKGNAYGLGAVKVCRALMGCGATTFAVACGDEAEELLDACPGAEVLILGHVGEVQALRLIPRSAIFTVYSREQGQRLARAAEQAGRPARVHIKADTGLHRLGFCGPNAVGEILDLNAAGWLDIEGLYTHLALHNRASDELQFARFDALRQALESGGLRFRCVHALDSIGMVRYPESHLDGARVGAWLYGVTPRRAPKPSHCVGCFKARIAQLRRVAKGELIGYDDDSPLQRDSVIATVSAGYIDGTPRVGDGWQVEIRGQRADVIGIACMDQLMADVTDIPEVAEGDEVVFVGGGIDVEEYSRMGRFNHNEAWARIGRRVPRIFYESGKPVRVRAEL